MLLLFPATLSVPVVMDTAVGVSVEGCGFVGVNSGLLLLLPEETLWVGAGSNGWLL